MLSKNNQMNRDQLEMITLEQLVPEDHIVRKIEQALDFSFIYPLVEKVYSADRGRPSIDPVILIKMTFIQYLFGIRSMRRTIEEIETNLAYRWFLGFGFHDKVPHFSTFGKNYERRFKDTDLFEQIFYRILKEAIDKKLVNGEQVFIDSTHVKASANKRKYQKKIVRKETKSYEERLQNELNLDREENGKKPFPPDKFEPEEKEIKESTTDPESGYYVKDERTKQFAYSFHAASDEKGFVLGTIVTPGNVHDSAVFEPLLDQVTELHKKPAAVAADAAYKNPALAHYLNEKEIRPVFPYTRPKTKDGFFKKSDYVYDEHFDCYICPHDQVLPYRTTTKKGYRQYSSDPKVCENCPFLSQCTESQNHQKLIERHLWQEYLDEAEHLRHTEENKTIYAKRKETIERVFADAKEKHGMRWTTLRGLKKLSMQAMLTFAAMNLKKLASWTWKPAKAA
ncbi:IS1182 family transposase [Metabacillus idriensis]|uniref:IS1182 family transposase n=1 Tax=Metabacillus idriensis TaxID=324768 RepID=UPI001749C7ED|nr:IS1182 family transposase [Metabacillus idriensis]